MKSKNIDELLNKYYDGETTVDEETELMEILGQEETGEFYQSEKDQFAFFEKERNADLPHEFDAKIEELIKESEEIKEARILPIIWRSAAAVLLVAVGLSFWFLKSNPVEWQEQVTLNTNQTEITLADGSKVSLNSNSSVAYPDAFGDKREIYFQGEGFFEIRPDPDRPFLIHTDHSVTEVLGTSFNIRNYPDEPSIEVTVASGKVSFSTVTEGLQERVFLLPNEQAVYSKKENRVRKSTIDNENYLGWKTGKLEFQHGLMKQVIQDLERFYKVKIDVANESLLNCYFKGSFENRGLEEVLTVLSYSMGISYELSDQKYVLSGEGCGESISY